MAATLDIERLSKTFAGRRVLHDVSFSIEPGEVRPGRVPLPPAFAVKALTNDTEGRFSLLEVTVARDIPRHTHHVADECIYVLVGELGVEFDDRTLTATKGMFVLLPHGVPHALRCASEPPPNQSHAFSTGALRAITRNCLPSKRHTHGSFKYKRIRRSWVGSE